MAEIKWNSLELPIKSRTNPFKVNLGYADNGS